MDARTKLVSLLAILLLAEGYQDVSIFEGGYPQWRDADKPVETGRP